MRFEGGALPFSPIPNTTCSGLFILSWEVKVEDSTAGIYAIGSCLLNP